MRTIQVINVRWFNATAWYALFLAGLLRDRGHPVLVIALPDTPPYQKARELGLDVRPLSLNSANPFKLLQVYLDLKKIVREFKPDVVNCHRGEAFFLWPLLQTGKKKFALIRTRGDQRPPKNNFFNKILHKYLCQAVIVTNTRMKKHFAEKFRLAPKKLHMSLGGVDENIFYPRDNARNDIRCKFGFAEKCLVLGLVGRFDTVKGQKELIESVGRLYHGRKIRNLRLFLIGFSSAITEETVRGWISRNNLDSICRISGSVDCPPEYISALDLAIINSQWSETIARAALEIMACQVPLISTDVGVIPDLLPAEALFKPGAPRQLDNAILKFQAKAKRKEILAKESERISRLTAENFVNKTLAVYRNASGTQPRPQI
ncbi:MAG: glycosyltransferase family 4 protein [Thermodesulfobacteriota bacterium]